jgi:hypothetical protein
LWPTPHRWPQWAWPGAWSAAAAGDDGSIPDAVLNDAPRVRTASAIIEWVNAHLDQVPIAPTEVGIDQQRRLEGTFNPWGRASRNGLLVLEKFEELLNRDLVVGTATKRW